MSQFTQEFDRDSIAWMIAELGNRFAPEIETDTRGYSAGLSPLTQNCWCRTTRWQSSQPVYVDDLLPYCKLRFPCPTVILSRGRGLASTRSTTFLVAASQPRSMSGKRVLDIGCNAGFDTFLPVNAWSSRDHRHRAGFALLFSGVIFVGTVSCPISASRKLRWQEAKGVGDRECSISSIARVCSTTSQTQCSSSTQSLICWNQAER